jgi:hypothetical protein
MAITQFDPLEHNFAGVVPGGRIGKQGGFKKMVWGKYCIMNKAEAKPQF